MEDQTFYAEYRANWADLDPNFHVRAGVWLDYATNTQCLWLEKFDMTQARYKNLAKKVRHSFEKGKGDRLGAMVMEGTGLNRITRQVGAPAPDSAEALNKLARTPNFEVMESFIREKGGKY